MHSITWTGQLHALSSIAHGGETRGTATLLRRERILRDGEAISVPIVSGNSWRGRLRRMAEEQLREAIGYEGQLTLAAAHTLRAGGSLAKGTTALTGARLRAVRQLVPPLAIFGGAVGRTIEGALQVGKLVPHVAETSHLTGNDQAPSMFSLLQLETYTRLDEGDRLGTSALMHTQGVQLLEDGSVDLSLFEVSDEAASDVPGSFVWRIETLPAGTVFDTWLRLEHVDELTLSFFVDLLERFAERGHIGGRAASGHGRVRSDLHPDAALPADLPDWRSELASRREEVLAAIAMLGS